AGRAGLEEALPLHRELRDRHGLADTLNDLGEVLRRQGDVDGAAALYEESLALRRALADRTGIAWSLHNLAYVALARGDPATAGLPSRGEQGHGFGIAACLAGLAAVACHSGGRSTRERGARLLGATQALIDTIGAPLDPANRAEYDRVLSLARCSLGGPVFFA